jgi:hypothetical protein
MSMGAGGGQGFEVASFIYWGNVRAKEVTYYRMGPFESKGSSPIRPKFTISLPFFPVNVRGGGRGRRSGDLK